MHLAPEETQLIGAWLSEGQLQEDANARRIAWLLEHQLRPVATHQSGWVQLYLNPVDGRYWKLSFPQSHLPGGGPPTLTCLDSGK